MTILDEKKIKCLLIDKLLKDYPKSIIGVEVPFLSEKRWVDVLLITKDNETIAFEIKSDLDTLRRLEGQIIDYLDTFNQVYLICSEKIINEAVVKKLSKRIGLISYNNNNKKLIIKRNPISKSRLSKNNLSYFIWKKDLISYSTNRRETVDSIRKRFITQNSIKIIHKLAIECLRNRYKPRFSEFLKEKSKYTHSEDLQYLTKTFGDLF